MQRTLYGERKGHYETRGLINVLSILGDKTLKRMNSLLYGEKKILPKTCSLGVFYVVIHQR